MHQLFGIPKEVFQSPWICAGMIYYTKLPSNEPAKSVCRFRPDAALLSLSYGWRISMGKGGPFPGKQYPLLLIAWIIRRTSAPFSLQSGP